MIVKLPIIEKTWNEEKQKVEVKKGELPVQIDTSFKAHVKWEEQFGKQMGIDLSTYTDRVALWIKDPSIAKTQLVGMLKLLYCYVNSDKLPTFIDFAALFDYDIADELIKKITVVLGEVNKSIGKN